MVIWVINYPNIIKNLIFHAVCNCVTVYDISVANFFFFLKRLQTITDFLFRHLFPHRREKLEEFLDSHSKLSPGTHIHFTVFPVCC